MVGAQVDGPAGKHYERASGYSKKQHYSGSPPRLHSYENYQASIMIRVPGNQQVKAPITTVYAGKIRKDRPSPKARKNRNHRLDHKSHMVIKRGSLADPAKAKALMATNRQYQPKPAPFSPYHCTTARYR